jgi:ATP-dependent Clp protease ATP-binding subunit ClpB
VLDDGRLTDGQGRTVDFRNTVIIMTSNLGSQMIQQMSGDDYGVIKLAVMAEVKTQFRPEFVNRIDEIVVFHSLSEQNIEAIAKIQMQGLESRLAKLEISMDVTHEALAAIASVGFDPVYGARPLKRAIQQEIENPLAKEILSGKFVAGDKVHVAYKNGKAVFSKH